MDKILVSNQFYTNAAHFPEEAVSTHYGGSAPVSLDWQTLVLEPLKGILAKVMGFIPNIVAAIGILLVGWIASKILMFVVKKFLNAISFDKIAERIGVVKVFTDSEAGVSPTVWTSRFSFWIGMFIAAVSAIGALRLNIVSFPLSQFGIYFSSMATMFLILVFGLFLSIVLSKIVEAMVTAMKAARPSFYGSLVRWTIIACTFIVVVSRLGVDGDIVSIIFTALLATLCIILILTFGLGGRAWAAKVLDKFTK